jgi:hypothetical protein
MGNKPALIVQDDFCGANNKDLATSTARVMKGASWKRQRIVCIIPAADLIPAKVALSLWNLAFPPNNGVVRILAQGMEVGEAYSNAVEQILAHPELNQWEYILCAEHDNAPPSDGVIKLIEGLEAHPEYSCLSGLYWTKFENGVPQCWGDVNDPVLNFRPQLPPANDEIKEYVGLGMGFCLFRLSMFKDERLRRPWFKTLNGKDGQGIGTQDLYAWADFRKYGYRGAVHGGVRVGHYDHANDMMW